MSFDERLAVVREELERREALEAAENQEPRNSIEEQLFQNGWPNCWGSFNNIMP
jgi:hypothetical protein